MAAGMQAPSAGDARPWEFIVEDRKDKFMKIMNFHAHSRMLETAQLIIIVCADITKEKFVGFWPQDCAACTQNILLQATHIGVGSVWLGVYPDVKRVEGIREMYDLPEKMVPFSIVALGYPKEKKKRVDKYERCKINYRDIGVEWTEKYDTSYKVETSKNEEGELDICISDMEFFAYHGVHDFEKREGQLFNITVTLSVNLVEDGIIDVLAQTIDYSEIAQIIRDITMSNKYDLIEFLAQQIAREILKKYHSIKRICVEVKKPNAPMNYKFNNVSVRVKMTRETLIN